MTLQPDGKIIVVGWCTVTYTDYTWQWSTDFALVRYNSDGSIDGKLTTDVGGYDVAYAVRVQPDGKVIVAGGGGNGSDFTLVRYNGDGTLDLTFSDDGKLTTDFGGYDCGYSITLQPDGKILAAGEGNADFAVARYNIDGTLDITFSDDGKLTTEFGGNDGGYSITEQPDGKILVAGKGNGDFALARYNSNGTLDTTFSVDGKLTTDFGGNFGGDDSGRSMILQPDGKIVVAGSSDGNFALARYNTDGTLDTTFSDDGKLTTDFGGDDYGNSVIIQSDGKIVVAGASNSDFALARYHADGTLDTTFTGDGKLITDFSGDDYGSSISVQPDGKITVAGESNGDFAVARYNSDGSFDKTFGNRFTDYALTPVDKVLYNFTLSSINTGSLYDIDGDGVIDRMDVSDNWMDRVGFLHTVINSYKLIWNDSTHWTVHALHELVFGAAVDSQGRPVTLYIDGEEQSIIWEAKTADNVIGTIRAIGGGDSGPVLIKLVDADGNNLPDQGFVVQGSEPATATTEPFLLLGWTSFNQAAVTVMMTSSEFSGRVALDAQNKPEALVLSSFSDGEGGRLTTDFGGEESALSMTVQPDGKILVAGYRFTDRDIINNIEANIDFALARYNADGSLDTTFSENGKLTTDFGWDDQAYSISVQLDQKIVVAGSSDGNFALVRYNADGSLDTTFSGDGKLITDFYGDDRVYSVKIQSDGTIIVAGASDDDFALARYYTDGHLDTTFSDDGMVTTDFGWSDYGKSMTLQLDGKIVVAGESDGNFALARYNTDGHLDTTFSDDGVVTTDLDGDDHGKSMILQPDGKIVVAGESDGNVALVRYNANGTLDVTFSDDGMLTTDLGGDDNGNSVILQSDGKIIVAGSSDNNFALARYNANGSLDTTFSGDGKLITDFYGDDKGYSVKVQSDGKILVAGASDEDFALARYNTDGTLDLNFGDLTTYVPLILPNKLENNLTDIFTISPVYTGKLFDVDGNGIPDRMDVVNTWENQDGYTEVSTACYQLAWNDNTHWTAKALEQLPFDLIYDSEGRPASLYGATINYMSTVTNGLLATVQWGDDTLQFIDTNGDNLSDQASYIEHVAGLVTYTFLANLINWTYDVNNHSTSVTMVMQTSSDPNDVFSGSVIGSNSDPSTIVMPSFNSSVYTIPGTVTTDFGGNDFGFSVAVLTDGKFLVAGTGNNDFAVARYNQNGSLDSTFDIDGKVTTDFGAYDGVFDVMVQLDGKILVSGSSNGDFALARYNIDGSLDTSFSGDGKVITESGGDDSGTGMTIQSDGKILLSGFSNEDFALVRYNSDGTLDASFSGDGIVITNIGNEDYASGVAVQADGKILVAGSTWLGNGNGNFALVRYNPDGSLDTSFSGDGIVTADIDYRDQGIGITLQNDGKIIVVGECNGDFAVVRYNTNGSLDTSFSEDGIVTTNVSNYDSAWSAMVQSDGKIIVAGYVNGGIDQPFSMQSDRILVKERDGNFALIRYNFDGSLDTSFGNGGVVTTDFGYNDIAFGIALQSDGKIFLSGGSNGDFALARYNADGTLDRSFDCVSDTIAPTVTSFSPVDGVLGVTVERDIVLTFNEAIQRGSGTIAIHSGSATGAIVASYDVATSHNLTITGNTLAINPVADLTSATHYFVTVSDGSVQDLAGNSYAGTASYDFTTSDGRIITDFGGSSFGFGMAIQSDGQILMTGTSNGDFAVARYNQNGSLDTTFDTDGKVTTDFGGYDFGIDVGVQSDGKFFVAGYKNDSGVVLACYNRDGSLDVHFGTRGKVVSDLVDMYHSHTSMALQSDGKILVAGGINGDFALARYTIDGTLDVTFNGNGEVTTDLGYNDQSGSVAVQSDGKILVAGSSRYYSYSDSDFALVRYNSNGTLDAGFGTGGKVTTDFDGMGDHGHGMAIQSDGKILVVGMEGIAHNDRFAVARYNIDGTLDMTFSGDGKVTTDLGGGLGFGVTVQSDGKILVAGYANQDGPFAIGDNSNCDFGLVRYDTDGTLDSTFGAGGKVVTDFGGTEFATSVALQSDGKIVLSGYSNNGFALACYNADGSLDASFIGGSGTDTAAPTVTTFTPADGMTGVVVDSNIVLTFNEAIQKGTGLIEIHSGSATGTVVASYDVATSSNLTIAGNTLTINPTADLTSATHYVVTFNDGSIKDLAGNGYSGTDTYDFTTASTSSVHDISGSVTFWKTSAAIVDVTSTLASDTMTSGTDGLYHHLDMPDGTYTLTSAKVSGMAESNAVKANDALAALKMAAGINPNSDNSPVSPYQFLAADVNHDGQVKAADALNILKMAVKLSTAPANEWLFVPESVGSESMSRTHVVWPDNPIPVMLGADHELDLIGIVKGDVNGSWLA